MTDQLSAIPQARIPDAEYKERAQRAAKLINERGLDVLLVNGNEADYANTRYFSGFWPVFERCGVAINPAGETVLMVGPESDIFAKDVSKIQNIEVLAEYRESADPAYPHLTLSSFQKAFDSIGVTGKRLRIGVASILDTNVVVWEALKEQFPEAELVDARDLMVELRSVKSENEIACLREGARITELAIDRVIEHIRPGMTELQLVGIAQETIYEHGAEYEGLPMYCFSGTSTMHAISRSSYKQLEQGDIIQLNLSAKVDGYSPAIGMPVSLGPMEGRRREIVEFVLEAHRWSQEQLAPGVPAAEIAKGYEDLYKERGFADSYVYGPCHGLGLIEVEAPWMETNSTYNLEPGMTFQIDSFGIGEDFGVRWEKPVAITESGIELLSSEIGKIIEI